MELRRVGVEAFDEIHPLLLGFRNRRMSRDDWRRMLFDYPWPAESRHGYALYAGGRVVGFLGTIFSTRRTARGPERRCCFSSWIVEEAHRGTSVLLMRRVLDELRDLTVVGHTPAPTTCAVFERLGFIPFETTRLLLPPLLGGGLSPATFTLAPAALRASLQDEDAAIHRDLSACARVRHVLLRHRGRQCYLVARLDRIRGLRAAELLHVSDWGFFWEHRLAAHAALLRALGAPALLVDARHAGDRRLAGAVRLPQRRLYRPAGPGVGPRELDGLYSELMTLRE